MTQKYFPIRCDNCCEQGSYWDIFPLFFLLLDVRKYLLWIFLNWQRFAKFQTVSGMTIDCERMHTSRKLIIHNQHNYACRAVQRAKDNRTDVKWSINISTLIIAFLQAFLFYQCTLSVHVPLVHPDVGQDAEGGWSVNEPNIETYLNLAPRLSRL